MTPEPPAPLLRVVRGNPSPDELAALVVVVAALQRSPSPAPPAGSRWGRPQLRRDLPRGAGAWRASVWPA